MNIISRSGNNLGTCARCGSEGMQIGQQGVCPWCEMRPQEEIAPVLCAKSDDKTQEKINVRNGIEMMYRKIKGAGLLASHKGIYLDEQDGMIAVKAISIAEPSEYFKWAQHRCERV